MYELFILSKLMHRPMHAYLLQAILNAAIGPFRRVSWGTLYPLMKKLEQGGLIVEVEENDDDPRGKKLYRTTETGKARFFELVATHGEFDADTPDLFSLKVGCFGHLEVESRLAVLADYRDYLSRVLAHCEAMIARIEGESGLPVEERRFAHLALQHKQRTAETELTWIDSLIRSPGLSATAQG